MWLPPCAGHGSTVGASGGGGTEGAVPFVSWRAILAEDVASLKVPKGRSRASALPGRKRRQRMAILVSLASSAAHPAVQLSSSNEVAAAPAHAQAGSLTHRAPHKMTRGFAPRVSPLIGPQKNVDLARDEAKISI